jgi:hypothetical protein
VEPRNNCETCGSFVIQCERMFGILNTCVIYVTSVLHRNTASATGTAAVHMRRCCCRDGVARRCTGGTGPAVVLPPDSMLRVRRRTWPCAGLFSVVSFGNSFQDVQLKGKATLFLASLSL